MPDPTNLNDLINDAPADLINEDNTNKDEELKTAEDDEVDIEESKDAEEETAEDTEEEENAEEDDKPKEDEEEEDDDYITKADLDESPPVVTPPAATTPAEEAEAQYVLGKLQKIPVRIVNADDKVETVEVYGYGDLPRDYKGIATPYEAGVFQTAVTNQLSRVNQLKTEFQQTQAQKMTEDYNKKEDRAIAEDLKELREEGVFPRFKGTPGTREFDTSDGAKEFDRVVAYMNEKNEEYNRRANSGSAFRHIGFAEAFALLNPGIREKTAAEDKGRRTIARKLKSSQGTVATKGKVNPAPVTNLTDLEEEFKVFTGANQ